MSAKFVGLLTLKREIECPPFGFDVGCQICGSICNGGESHLWYVEAVLLREDTITKEWSTGRGGRIYFDQSITYDALVKKFFVAARDYAEHEVREAFKYKGRRVLGPHIPIVNLWDAAND